MASGRFVRIRARGRTTGASRSVTVGFVEEPGTGNILVAAGSPETAWALNLDADPRCEVTIGDRVCAAVAEPLDRVAHAAAVRGLILRYGTPAEALGRGPSFRLVPVETQGTAAASRGDG